MKQQFYYPIFIPMIFSAFIMKPEESGGAEEVKLVFGSFELGGKSYGAVGMEKALGLMVLPSL